MPAWQILPQLPQFCALSWSTTHALPHGVAFGSVQPQTPF
jgi:hypothetical protein